MMPGSRSGIWKTPFCASVNQTKAKVAAAATAPQKAKREEETEQPAQEAATALACGCGSAHVRPRRSVKSCGSCRPRRL